MKTKICRVCEKEKQIEQFQKRTKILYRTECKNCLRIAHKNWRKLNREKVNTYWKAYRKKNKEKYKEYYNKDRDKILIKKKDYYMKNIDAIKETHTKYRKENPRKVNEQNKNSNRTEEGYKKYLYRCIKHRLKCNKYYKNRKLFFTRDEFLNWIDSNSDYKKLYEDWVKRSYKNAYSPSVDRIDNFKDYSLDNIQILTRSENSRKLMLQDFPRKIIKDFIEKGKLDDNHSFTL